jgi:hypothetical protein
MADLNIYEGGDRVGIADNPFGAEYRRYSREVWATFAAGFDAERNYAARDVGL